MASQAIKDYINGLTEILELGPNDLLIVRDSETGASRKLKGSNLVGVPTLGDGEVIIGGALANEERALEITDINGLTAALNKPSVHMNTVAGQSLNTGEFTPLAWLSGDVLSNNGFTIPASFTDLTVPSTGIYLITLFAELGGTITVQAANLNYNAAMEQQSLQNAGATFITGNMVLSWTRNMQQGDTIGLNIILVGTALSVAKKRVSIIKFA